MPYTIFVERKPSRWLKWVGLGAVVLPLLLLPFLWREPAPPDSLKEVLRLPAIHREAQVNVGRDMVTNPPQETRDWPAWQASMYHVGHAEARRLMTLLKSDHRAGWREKRRAFGGISFSSTDFEVAFVPIERALPKDKPRPPGIAYEIRVGEARYGLGHEARYQLYKKFGIGGP